MLPLMLDFGGILPPKKKTPGVTARREARGVVRIPWGFELFGVNDGIRTHDLRGHNPAL